MRHSTTSIMAARGERPEMIQRVMRHAKVSFTLDRYVKVYRDDIRDAVQRNDALVTAEMGTRRTQRSSFAFLRSLSELRPNPQA